MSKQRTAGKRKHITLTICQKLEIIRQLETDKSQEKYFFLQHSLVNCCMIKKETEGPIMIIIVSTESVNVLFK